MKVKPRAGRIIPALILFFLFSFFAIAGTEYQTISGSNLTFTSNSIQINNDDDGIVTVSHEAFSPIVADLNNDGTNEIVVFDIENANPALWTAYAYEQNTLTALDSITLNVSGSTILSNFEVMDSDNDGLNEIYYAHFTGSCVYRLEFNTSDKFERGGQNCDGSFTSADVLMIKCHDGQDLCAIISSKQTFPSAFARLSTYNVTHTTTSGDTVNLFNDGGIDDGMCMSNIKSFGLSDYNPNNGDYLEVVQTYLVVDSGTEGCVAVATVHHQNISDLTASVNSCTTVGASVWTDTQPNCIADEYSYHISPPLIMDTNGFPSDGDEIVFAVPASTSTFKLMRYKIDGTFQDDYPATGSIDGSYVSNPFRANALGTSGYEDFCAIGFNVADGTNSQMVCGSAQNTAPLFWFLTTDTIAVDYSTEAGNITPTEFHYPNLVFGVEHDDGNSYSEVLSVHGIHSFTTSSDDLNTLYEMPFSNLQVIPVDAEQVGYDDLLAGSGTLGLFYYIDDGFTNSNCEDDNCLKEVYLNPCVDGGNVRNGTQIQVNTLVQDVDGDDINVNITLFEGAPYEQSLNRSNQTSGSYLTFLFQLDGNTTNTGLMNIDVWDRENPSKIETQTYNFVVTPSGFDFGDNDCTENTTVVDTVTTATTTQSATENILDNSFEGVSNVTGLSTMAIWYLFLIVFLGYMGYTQVSKGAVGSSTAFFTLGIALFWIFLGAFRGIVPFEHLVVVLTILGVVGGILFFGLFKIGSGSGG